MPVPLQTVPTFVVSNAPSGETDAHVLALQNGQFDIAWGRFLSPSDSDARIYRFGADGGFVSASFFIGPVDHIENQPSLASLGSTQAAVFVYDQQGNVGSSIRLTLYNRNSLSQGGAQDDSVLIATGTNELRLPEVAALQGGQLAITWLDVTGGSVMARIYNPFTGSLSSALVVSNSPVGDVDFDLGMTALSNGNFAVSWRDDQDSTYFRIIGANTDFVSPEIAIEGGIGGADIIELANGNIAVTYNSTAGLAMQTYDQFGESVGSASIIYPAGAPNDYLAATALLDGRLMVVWEFNQNILGRIMDADGTPDSDVFNVASTVDNEWTPHLATLADGRVVVTYDNGTDGNIYATIYDPREAGVSVNGTNGADEFIGSAFADTFVMGAGNDDVQGGGGDDIIDGGLGADTMAGGAGNDTYTVDNLQDVVDESLPGSSGTDLVRSFGSVDLSDTMHFLGNIENVRLLGSSHVDAVGNALANELVGNGGNNILHGRNGDDILDGGDGNDQLSGGLGADQHVGGSGLDFARYDDADYGNLTIRLDNAALNVGAAAVGDTYSGIECLVAGAGNDTVVGDNFANRLFGQGGTDTILGRDGNDILDGGEGNDHLYGGLGADQHIGGAGLDFARYDDANYGNLTIRLDNAALNVGAAAVGDTYNGIECLVGGLGNDTVVGDNLANRLYGQGGSDTIFGRAGNDILDGGAGNDFLNGGLGNDTLTGGGDNDTFFFNTALNAATNVDTITDFSVPNDTIRLEDAIFTAIGPAGVLAAAAFTIGAAATTAAHRIVYNSATGALIYDSNGSAAGGATQFAVLGTGLALTNADFLVA
ncbi:Bifunctional hemolysin/adenylate cyclase [Rhizobiaceae bacterium]|nr:Bifunctional hemolysin/adenylate cyclase [Rhizobiaceae bacterium]